MSYPEEVSSVRGDRGDKEKNLIGKVISDLGGVLFAVEVIDKTLEFISNGFKNNNFYQGLVKGLRGLTPLLLTGYKIRSSIYDYYREKKMSNARMKKNVHILELMNIKNADEYDLNCFEFSLGNEIIRWFLTAPKTERFIIKDFYNSEFENFSPKSVDKGEYYIYVDCDSHKYMINFDITQLNNQIVVSSNYVYTLSSWEKIHEFKANIFSEFVKHLDIEHNVIEYISGGLYSRPRKKIDFDIIQFNVDSFKTEIKKAIEKNKRRGYVIVGPPGVGKSTVVVKMEHELNNYPIVYISSSAASYREDIRNLFNFLRSISPCIAMFEDLDSYELGSKQDRIFGEFIEQTDGLKHEECVIMISTVNEPENIHGSYIARTGRVDKLFFIGYPKCEKEVLSVMNNRYKIQTGKDFPFNTLEDNLVKSIHDNNISHSDICEIVDHLYINDIEFTHKSIKESFDVLMESKNVLKQCCAEPEDLNNGPERTL
jgi:predicted RNase H-related nuclease YkuK (DUF458 family)